MIRLGASAVLASTCIAGAFAQGWLCYGGNPQHNGAFTGTSQSASLIQWQTPLDDNRSYYGGAVLIHYAAPMVTPANTVVYGYRTTTVKSGVSNYDNWSVVARAASTGSAIWSMPTDYSAAIIFPNSWTSVFPVTLYQLNTSNLRGVAAAGSGGSIMTRDSADAAASQTNRIVFYTSTADFNSNKAAYSPIKINTPLTADTLGNIYFGYEVTGTIPSAIATKIGTGGIAKINVLTGAKSYVPVTSMKVDASLSRLAMNAAPALTPDQKFIYIAVTGGNPYLVKLSTKDLSTSASVRLLDGSAAGQNANLINESSASPMIGPDGHVFMGVFGYQWRESHGWMLQFDGNLNPNDAKGKRWPVGAFGWDDTAVVVPKALVPSYKGKSTYLILTKYNNYDMGGDAGADGSNKIAILDPLSNAVTKDRQSGVPVMDEIITVLGPTRTNDDSNHPQARNEWCINSAAIDINRKSAIINSEDGHMYRWSFVTNTLVEDMNLQPPTGEAYTETAIGPDGQIYVINNSILFAIGSTKPTAVIASKGSGASGNVASITTIDGSVYAINSVTTTTGQAAAIEADFTLQNLHPSCFNLAVDVAAAAGVTGTASVYNYVTKTFDVLGTGDLTATLTQAKFTATTKAPQYVDSKGRVRVLIQGTTNSKTAKFKLSADQITCNAR